MVKDAQLVGINDILGIVQHDCLEADRGPVLVCDDRPP